MGRPPGSRSAAACRALGDNVLSAPRNARKRGRTVVCRLSSHSASPRNVAHLLLLLSSSVLHTPGAPRPLSLHLFLVLPCSDAAPLVLLARLPRLSTVARPTPALLTACCALWRGCASASARRCPSQSPSDLEAASSTSVRPPRPFVLASPLHAPFSSPCRSSTPRHRHPPCTQVFFGAIYKSRPRDPSLVSTLARASRGTDGRDVAGVALLDGHPFLQCEVTVSQSARPRPAAAPYPPSAPLPPGRSSFILPPSSPLLLPPPTPLLPPILPPIFPPILPPILRQVCWCASAAILPLAASTTSP
jgi:hypothetical protein